MLWQCASEMFMENILQVVQILDLICWRSNAYILALLLFPLHLFDLGSELTDLGIFNMAINIDHEGGQYLVNYTSYIRLLPFLWEHIVTYSCHIGSRVAILELVVHWCWFIKLVCYTDTCSEENQQSFSFCCACWFQNHSLIVIVF